MEEDRPSCSFRRPLYPELQFRGLCLCQLWATSAGKIPAASRVVDQYLPSKSVGIVRLRPSQAAPASIRLLNSVEAVHGARPTARRDAEGQEVSPVQLRHQKMLAVPARSYDVARGCSTDYPSRGDARSPFVTAQGSAHMRFRRAWDRGNVTEGALR